MWTKVSKISEDDDDGGGGVSQLTDTQFLSFLLGWLVGLAEVEQIIEEADEDGNGKIGIQEFTTMINDAASTLDTYDKRLKKRYASVKY